MKQGLRSADEKNILTESLFLMAKLLETEHSAVLREHFSSPRGTTIDGLLSLEEDRARYGTATLLLHYETEFGDQKINVDLALLCIEFRHQLVELYLKRTFLPVLCSVY